MSNYEIARIAHQANKAICEAFGDKSQKDWEEAAGWQQLSAEAGVQFVRDNLDASPSAQHDAWMNDKLNDGWRYGPVRDPDNKLHHCLVPYEQLPPEQRAKDYVFRAVVLALLSR